MAGPHFTQLSGRPMWEQCDHLGTRMEGAYPAVCLAPVPSVDEEPSGSGEEHLDQWLTAMGSAVVVPFPPDAAERRMVLLADPTKGLLGLEASGWEPHEPDVWPWSASPGTSLVFSRDLMMTTSGSPSQIALDHRQRLWVLHPGAGCLFLFVNGYRLERSVTLPVQAPGGRWAMGCSASGVVVVSEDLGERWLLPWGSGEPWQQLLPGAFPSGWTLLSLCADPAWDRMALVVQTEAGARLVLIEPQASSPRVFEFPLLHNPVHGVMVDESRWLVSEPRFGPGDSRVLPFREFRLESNTLQAEAGYAVRGFDGRALWRLGERVFASTAKGARELFRHEQPLRDTGSVETWALDSGCFGCTWHRLFVDCCLPVGSAIRVEARTSDELPPRLLRRQPRRPTDETQELSAPWLAEAWKRWPPLASLDPDDKEGWVGLNVPDRRVAYADLPLPPHGIERASDDLLADARESNPAPPQGMLTLEWLITAPPGRYLWLRIHLQGTAKQSPRLYSFRATYPRWSLLDYLPAFWKDDGEGGRSTEQALALFEGLLTELDGRSQALVRLFKPGITPSEALPWLADFMALSYDERIGVPVRRQLLGEIMTLYRQRGTLPGLTRLLSLLAEAPVQIVEGFRLRSPGMSAVGGDPLGAAMAIGAGEGIFDLENADAWERELRLSHAALLLDREQLAQQGEKTCPETDPPPPLSDNAVIAFYRRQAHRFTVLVPRTETAQLKAVLCQAIEFNKPAHTLHRLCWVNTGYRIGTTSLVGIHSLGNTPRAAPTVVGDAVLGPLSSLNEASDAFTARKPAALSISSTITRGEAP